MTEPCADPRPTRTRLVAAFGAIYLIWGSTYLAIRFAVESVPPLLMAATRFLVAGALLYLWARLRSKEKVTWVQWRSAAIIGGLLLLGGNGLVSWAEQTVPSGFAALMVTTVPIWMVLLHWVRRDGARPTVAEGVGVLLGFGGVVLLVGMNDDGSGAVDRVGAISLIVASLLWSFGSLYSRDAPLPRSPLLATSMEMLCGGALLALTGLLLGEGSRLFDSRPTALSLFSLAYLTVFGSLIAFSAYVWLLRVSTPARVSTYAFVNPVVAVLLGCTLGGEFFTPQFFVASVIIVGAVVLIITSRSRKTVPPITVPEPIGITERAQPVSKVPSQVCAADRTELTAAPKSFTLANLLDEVQRGGRPYHEFLRVPSMSLGIYYLPVGGVDGQLPHGEDEVYYVLGGCARFRVGNDLRDVGPGAILFVPAGRPHRFESIKDELILLVLFAPAEDSAWESLLPLADGCEKAPVHSTGG